MLLREFYNQIIESLPLECEPNEDVRSLLTRKFRELLITIEQINENERWVLGNRYITVKSLSDVCKLMVKCLDEIHSGLHVAAIKTLDQCFNMKSFNVITIKHGGEFYRMRKVDNSSQLTVKDMFHIPFSKRHIIGSQRYSTPGVPYLYLSSRICCCWEELNRPRLSDCMVSQFVLTQDIKVLDINLMPYECIDKGRITWLHLIPFVMACMIKVKDETYKFKDEYIFPQIIMEWVLSSEMAKNENIRGIRYTSVKKNRTLGYKDKDYICFAIPAVPFESNASLNDIFSLTEPTSDEIERIRNHKYGINMSKCRKQITIFDHLENALKDRTRFPLKHVETEITNKNITLESFIDLFDKYITEYNHITTLEKQAQDFQKKESYQGIIQNIKCQIINIYNRCPDIQYDEHLFHFLSDQNFNNDIHKILAEIKEKQNIINKNHQTV